MLRYETDEPFVPILVMHLEGLLQTFKNSLTESNYNALIGIVTTEVASRLEKVVLKSTFNRVSRKLNNSKLSKRKFLMKKIVFFMVFAKVFLMIQPKYQQKKTILKPHSANIIFIFYDIRKNTSNSKRFLFINYYLHS